MHDTKRDELTVRQERAILVGTLLPGEDHGGEGPLDELQRLAETAGALVVGRLTQKLPQIDPRTYIGQGKAQELAELCTALDADAVLCDHDLSPAQLRNLERITEAKVLDHSELILDIFATRAKTRQAKVQVELAQLEYTLPRLTRMWSHLDRTGAGIGTRGPGERQLETDRRVITRRMSHMRRELGDIASRKLREVSARREEFKVCLVGYTNAGKSTLLNALTHSHDAFVEDRLFATLDTKTRVWPLDSSHRALLSDTVGFIRRLPHHLIASFHATLEEATEADLLIHVIDVSHRDCFHQAEVVRQVLAELGCAEQPVLNVLNKTDVARPTVEADLLAAALPEHIRISALVGTGLDQVREHVLALVTRREARVTIHAHCGSGRLLACVHEHASILASACEDERMVFQARVEPRHLPTLRAAAGPNDSIVVHPPSSLGPAAESGGAGAP
ncbi:MAG TPA: GTPase HflX [Planctomycetota bacterium]|nr:GTPase HflX [Planctomycetota bacterium]